MKDNRNPAKKQKTAPVVERLNALEKLVSDLKQDKKQHKFHDGEERRFQRRDAHQFSSSPQHRIFRGNAQRITGNCYACNRPGHRFLQCQLASQARKQEIKDKMEAQYRNSISESSPVKEPSK